MYIPTIYPHAINTHIPNFSSEPVICFHHLWWLFLHDEASVAIETLNTVVLHSKLTR